VEATAEATPVHHSHRSHWTESWRPGSTSRSCWTRIPPQGPPWHNPPLPDREVLSLGSLNAVAGRCGCGCAGGAGDDGEREVETGLLRRARGEAFEEAAEVPGPPPTPGSPPHPG